MQRPSVLTVAWYVLFFAVVFPLVSGPAVWLSALLGRGVWGLPVAVVGVGLLARAAGRRVGVV